ncbi:signal peptidase I [Candidatus Woesearchaeota archaeon]|jgi:hypothetical protein|nr:signal peptidase I [Candidatus Woesearchaeota archaeon]
MKEHLKKTWKFFWDDDSIWSWLANIIVAFLVIRFLVYPLLGVILGTGFPIVAVISESMEHGTHADLICGQKFTEFPESFDSYWQVCGQWYESNGITKEQFNKFPFRDGFRKGDVIILWRANKNNLDVGDVLIFQGSKPQPLIHRVVKVWEEDSQTYYQTKGDHNSGSISGSLGEEKISEDRLYGKGVIRVPYLGWIKILFVDAVKPLGINIVR